MALSVPEKKALLAAVDLAMLAACIFAAFALVANIPALAALEVRSQGFWSAAFGLLLLLVAYLNDCLDITSLRSYWRYLRRWWAACAVTAFIYLFVFFIFGRAASASGGESGLPRVVPELADLKQYAKRFPAARVLFAGRVTDEEKVALLRQCRAFVLPSHIRSEAYGMVLVEASIYAKPMVTCEVGSGTSYVNLDGETGFVVEPANPKALADALNRLLDNPSAALEMGSAARRRYERLFTARAMGDAYAKLYSGLLERGQLDRGPSST